VAVVRLARTGDSLDRNTLITIFAVVVIVLLLTAFIPERKDPAPEAGPTEFDAFAGGYPVPPMPGQRLPESVVTVPADSDDHDSSVTGSQTTEEHRG
jgi:NADH-quinone oxidoreductase subunit H